MLLWLMFWHCFAVMFLHCFTLIFWHCFTLMSCQVSIDANCGNIGTGSIEAVLAGYDVLASKNVLKFESFCIGLQVVAVMLLLPPEKP